MHKPSLSVYQTVVNASSQYSFVESAYLLLATGYNRDYFYTQSQPALWPYTATLLNAYLVVVEEGDDVDGD